MPNNKNSFYFPHDCNAKDDHKLLRVRGKFGAEGYGVFWMCLETMINNSGYIPEDLIEGLAVSFGVPMAQLMAQLSFFCDVGLFKKTAHGFNSERMNDYIKFRKERSTSGSKGAMSRWNKPDGSAIAQPLAQPMLREEKRREENKGDFPTETVEDKERDKRMDKYHEELEEKHLKWKRDGLAKLGVKI